MCCPHIERVVDHCLPAAQKQHQIGYKTTYHTNSNTGKRTNKAAGRGDSNQSAYRACYCCQGTWSSILHPAQCHPRQGRRCCCRIGDNEGTDGQGRSCQSTSRVKTEPAEPEQGCPQNGERN